MKANVPPFRALALVSWLLTCGSLQATSITITHTVEGPPLVSTDVVNSSIFTLPQLALGDLVVPEGSMSVPGFHVVLFLDPVTLSPTALVTCGASLSAPGSIFVAFSFYAEGAAGFAPQVAVYTGQSYTSTVLADGSLQDVSPLLQTGQLQFLMQVSTVHPISTPESGTTAALLVLAVVSIAGFGRKRRKFPFDYCRKTKT